MNNGNRYAFDRGMCDTKKGFAQIDTSQDAHYYGQWVNPFEYKIVAYVEGDVILTECDTEKEFVSQLRQIEKWNNDMGHTFIGIDPRSDKEIRQKFIDLGLNDLLTENR